MGVNVFRFIKFFFKAWRLNVLNIPVPHEIKLDLLINTAQ